MTFLAPRPAAAATTTHTFATVDAVELAATGNSMQVGITGILIGQTTPTTHSFGFYSSTNMATHCHHLAVIAMAKPGKYRFAIGSEISVPGGCKLLLQTP